jgi:flotillin
MLSAFLSPAVVGIAVAVIAVIIVITLVVRRYRIVKPDTAMIVVGNRGKSIQNEKGQQVIDLSGQKVVTGGGTFVWPFIQQAFELELRSRRLALTTTGQTKNGITLSAQAVAVIKVGGSEEMIRAAAQRFLSQQDEIETSAQEVLSGSLRSILGNLTVQEIIQDRSAVASLVLSAAEEALSKQGLVIDTLQIQEIKDTGDYISNLGRPEAAAVRRAAEVADTEANRASEEARIEAEKLIIDKTRELRLKEAAVQAETDKAAATAAAAKPLEEAQQRQRITEQESITAQRKADLQEQELNASVRKVADAEAYRLAAIARAEAEAQIARAEAEKRERELVAEAVAAEGRAEAEAIAAKGRAEAEAIAARAEALATESQAVLAQQMIGVLPAVAEKFAEAYASSNITIVSADGANKVTGDMVGGIASVNTLMKDVTGIDITGIINGRAVGEGVAEGLGKAKGGRLPRQQKLESTPKVKAEAKPVVAAPAAATTARPDAKPETSAPATPVKEEPKATPAPATKPAGAPPVVTETATTPAKPSEVKPEVTAEEGQYDMKMLANDLTQFLTKSKALNGKASSVTLPKFQEELSNILNGVEWSLEEAGKRGIKYKQIPFVSDALRDNVRGVIAKYEAAVVKAGFALPEQGLLENYPLIKDFLK